MQNVKTMNEIDSNVAQQ